MTAGHRLSGPGNGVTSANKLTVKCHIVTFTPWTEYEPHVTSRSMEDSHKPLAGVSVHDAPLKAASDIDSRESFLWDKMDEICVGASSGCWWFYFGR